MNFNENIPSSAVKFYIKLYNSKNNIPQRNIKEAMKSLVRLKPEDKQFIINKFNEYCKTQKNKHAEYLKNMEPYLKKKKTKLGAESTSQHYDQCEHETPHDQPNESMNNTWENIADNTMVLPPSDSDVVIEPVPPAFKNAKDLFNLMQSTDSELEDMSWSSLPVNKKRRFQTAAMMLKKDYIDNYKCYLKSLSSLELYRLLKDTELNIERNIN